MSVHLLSNGRILIVRYDLKTVLFVTGDNNTIESLLRTLLYDIPNPYLNNKEPSIKEGILSILQSESHSSNTEIPVPRESYVVLRNRRLFFFKSQEAAFEDIFLCENDEAVSYPQMENSLLLSLFLLEKDQNCLKFCLRAVQKNGFFTFFGNGIESWIESIRDYVSK